MIAQTLNQTPLFTLTSSNGTRTTYDPSVRPTEGDLVLYETPSGVRRSSIVETRFGVLVFEVCGVFSPLGWVKVIGVAVGVEKAEAG